MIYADASLLTTFRPLTYDEEMNLNQCFIEYQQRDANAIIYFLRSRTSYCVKQAANNHDIIQIYQDLYGENGTIFERFTRPLLQIIEHFPHLSIVYDPAATDTKRANALSEEGTRGSFSRDSHTIRIAGRPAENYVSVRGTIAHEICHAVCYLLWKNECEPFALGTQEASQFHSLYKVISGEFENTKIRGNLDTLVQEVFFYPQEKHQRELIVRIPQIIATYGIEHAQELCRQSPGFQQLFNYYLDIVLPKAKEYLQNILLEKQTLHPNKPVDNDIGLLATCQTMTGNSLSLLRPQEAALLLQSFYKAALQRGIFIYLMAAKQSCQTLVALLDTLGCHEEGLSVHNKVTEKISFITQGGYSLFGSFKASKELALSFQKSGIDRKTNISGNSFNKM